MADWLLVLTLCVLGFILLLTELLIIPGFGLVGIFGLASLVYGLYIAITRLSPILGIIISLASMAIIIGMIRFFPKTAVWKKLRLERAERGSEGFRAQKGLEGYIGKTGISITPLRPSGTAKIEGDRVDVVTEGIFLPEATRIKVISVQGNRVVVRKENK